MVDRIDFRLKSEFRNCPHNCNQAISEVEMTSLLPPLIVSSIELTKLFSDYDPNKFHQLNIKKILVQLKLLRHTYNKFNASFDI